MVAGAVGWADAVRYKDIDEDKENLIFALQTTRI